MAITKVSPDLLDLDAGITITTADNSTQLTLLSTDADAAAGPNLDLYRNSSSPADNDNVGQINWFAENDAGEKIEFAEIRVDTSDVSNGSEDARVLIQTATAGGIGTSRLEILPTESVFNQDSVDVDFRVESNGNTHMLFVDGGNDCVSIGASTDLTGALNITHGNDFGLVTSGSFNFQAKFESTDAEAGIVIEDSNSGTDYNRIGVITNDMAFTTNNSEKMRILADGKVGIGTASPAQLLHVETTASPIATFRYNSSNRVDVRYDGLDIYGGAFRHMIAGTEKMRLDTSGNLIIGDTAFPSGSNSCFGVSTGGTTSISRAATNLQTQMSFMNPNGTVGTIKTTGTATQFNTSSDYRLKENVVTDWDGTTLLKQLKPSKFNFKADTDTTIQGFLAHEVSSIVPQAVSGEKDAVYTAEEAADGEGVEGQPNYQGIDHSKLVPLLVKTIQELEARITTLEG